MSAGHTSALHRRDELCAARFLAGTGDGVRLAREIKVRIAATVGECLRSSIGIAPNGFLAKTASDMQKPDGLVVIEESDLPEVLVPPEITRFLRHRRSEGKPFACLRNHEPSNNSAGPPKKSCSGPGTELRAIGFMPFSAARRSSGPPSERCTVGHSHVLEPKCRTRPLAEAVLHRLLQKAAARLRALGYLAGGLAVSVKFLGHQRWGDEMSFLETQDTLDFIRIFEMLWRRCPASLPPPLAVGMTLFHLTAAHNATPNLPQLKLSRWGQSLDLAVDRLNQCYGKNTVYFGGAQTALDSAPTRIAFTHIPALEKERG